MAISSPRGEDGGGGAKLGGGEGGSGGGGDAGGAAAAAAAAFGGGGGGGGGGACAAASFWKPNPLKMAARVAWVSLSTSNPDAVEASPALSSRMARAAARSASVTPAPLSDVLVDRRYAAAASAERNGSSAMAMSSGNGSTEAAAATGGAGGVGVRGADDGDGDGFTGLDADGASTRGGKSTKGEGLGGEAGTLLKDTSRTNPSSSIRSSNPIWSLGLELALRKGTAERSVDEAGSAYAVEWMALRRSILCDGRGRIASARRFREIRR